MAAKPAKKAKKEAPAVVEAPDVAAVGDAELARSGKPIVKKLYKEHPDVKALTQEKVCAGGGGGRPRKL